MQAVVVMVAVLFMTIINAVVFASAFVVGILFAAPSILYTGLALFGVFAGVYTVPTAKNRWDRINEPLMLVFGLTGIVAGLVSVGARSLELVFGLVMLWSALALGIYARRRW